MPVIDVATFVGPYPYRHLDQAGADALLRQMDRLGIDEAWVGYLPSILYKDPAPGNTALLRTLAPAGSRLRGVPTIHPGLPRWEEDVNLALAREAPAVRLYPQYQALDPAGPEMRVAVAAAAMARLPAILTVRFEDLRQRHPRDTAGELPAAAVRSLARSDPGARLVVTHASRAYVEEVHFGLTPEEASRILWDISWIWGPPGDDLRLLMDTVGVDRFVLGTGMPLRIPDAPFANLDLAELAPEARAAVLGGNLERWTGA